MKIKIKTKEFNDAVHALKAHTGESKSNPVLKNILVHIENDIIKMTASSSEASFIVRLNVDSDDQSEREFLIDATFFANILGTIKDESITIELAENENSTIGCAIYTSKGRIDFVTESPDLFPSVDENAFEDSDTIEVNTKDFSYAISRSIPFQYTDDKRPQFEASLMVVKPEGLLSIYASDMHNIIRYSINTGVFDKSFKALLSSNITKTLSSFKSDGTMSIAVSDKKVRFKTNNTTFICQKLEFAYPDCDKVICNPTEHVLNTNTEDVISTLKQVQVLTWKGGSAVVKMLNDNNIVSMSINDFAMGRNAEVSLNNELIKKNTIEAGFLIGFSADSMLNAISSIKSKNISMYFDHPQKPILIKETDENCQENGNVDILVMPMLIN